MSHRTAHPRCRSHTPCAPRRATQHPARTTTTACAGARVALRNDSYALHILLPSKIDPLVSLMKVEKVPDSTYDMIGGCDQQIKEIKEVCVCVRCAALCCAVLRAACAWHGCGWRRSRAHPRVWGRGGGAVCRQLLRT
jgi:hypothetical protein